MTWTPTHRDYSIFLVLVISPSNKQPLLLQMNTIKIDGASLSVL